MIIKREKFPPSLHLYIYTSITSGKRCSGVSNRSRIIIILMMTTKKVGIFFCSYIYCLNVELLSLNYEERKMTQQSRLDYNPGLVLARDQL